MFKNKELTSSLANPPANEYEVIKTSGYIAQNIWCKIGLQNDQVSNFMSLFLIMYKLHIIYIIKNSPDKFLTYLEINNISNNLSIIEELYAPRINDIDEFIDIKQFLQKKADQLNLKTEIQKGFFYES